MKELGYHSISAFIRDAILDEKLTALIHRHANRIRLIVVELVGKMDYLRRLLGESHEKK